jgi:hypothetical protein
MSQACYREWKAELMDELKLSPAIRLNSELLLSGNVQQVGSME